MTARELTVITGTIVEERNDFSLDELTEFCAVERHRIVELVHEGVLDANPQEMRFSGASLQRARVALRLQRDLGVNAPGIALALDLLERIEALEARLGGR
jgi:chaperone modulatory protein CbpM